MPIEGYMLKLQCQKATWFSAVSTLYRMGFEFVQGMALAGFICASTPATATMIDTAETGLRWCGYMEGEIGRILYFYPHMEGAWPAFLKCSRASFEMMLNIAPKLPYYAWPPMSPDIGKCEDFWKLRDVGVY